MPKKTQALKFALKFFLVRPNSWVCYDVEDCKLEVSQIEEVWIAALTLDDPYGYFYNFDFMEAAPNKTLALMELLSTPGLPYLMNLTQSKTQSLWDQISKPQIYWQYPDGEFYLETKPDFVSGHKLQITFIEQDKNAWIYYYLNLCKVEVINVDNKWIASAIPIKNGETVDREEISVIDTNLENAVKALVNTAGLPRTFALSHDLTSKLDHFYDSIKIIWQVRRKPAPLIKLPVEEELEPLIKPLAKKKPSPLIKPIVDYPESLLDLECKWSKTIDKCDNTGNCSFCAASGTAYFMRWDD